MTIYRFYEEGVVPEFISAEWNQQRERADHWSDGMHQGRLLIAAEFVKNAVLQYDIKSVSDLGAGDGGLLSHLKPFFQEHNVDFWGYDLSLGNIKGATKDRNVNVSYADVVNDDIEFGELSIATEFLEHLLDPMALVRKIGKNSKVLVASSPNGETPEAHYEYHTFGFDEDGYRELLTQGGFTPVAMGNFAHFQIHMGVKDE